MENLIILNQIHSILVLSGGDPAFLSASSSKTHISGNHFFFLQIFLGTFMNCGIVYWVSVSSLKLSGNGLH